VCNTSRWPSMFGRHQHCKVFFNHRLTRIILFRNKEIKKTFIYDLIGSSLEPKCLASEKKRKEANVLYLGARRVTTPIKRG